MHLISEIVTLLLAGVLLVPASATERLVTGGIVRGEVLPDGGTIFRSIPYARPPAGDLRWRPPVPVERWEGVRDSTKPGRPCLQRSYGWNATDAAASSEDCLYLSVHSPRHAPTDRLPVMVFIHGGANRAGSGSGFAESLLVNHDVVLVTMQYRLGVFGFISLPELTAESPEHASGNYGLLDQIAALKWVQANIARFGGDPDNVTIFGHSAGAQDVGLLMLSPLARGLFHKAIMQSGTPGFGVPPRSLIENEKIGRDLAKLVEAPDGPDRLRALRAASGNDLLNATDKLLPPENIDPSFIWMQAVVDGWVLPSTPKAILGAGEQAPVPLIVGNSVREFTVEGARVSARQWVVDNFGANADRALAAYRMKSAEPVPEDPLLGSIVEQISADVIFRCPANSVAERQLALTPKVWRYQLDVAKPGLPQPAIHGSELPFVFDEPPRNVSHGEWPPMQAYWTNFARNGDPNGPGLPEWPQMGAQKSYMEFTAQGPRAGNDLRGAICGLVANP
jgi:para-nitrobenzyl esterase